MTYVDALSVLVEGFNGSRPIFKRHQDQSFSWKGTEVSRFEVEGLFNIFCRFWSLSIRYRTVARLFQASANPGASSVNSLNNTRASWNLEPAWPGSLPEVWFWFQDSYVPSDLPDLSFEGFWFLSSFGISKFEESVANLGSFWSAKDWSENDIPLMKHRSRRFDHVHGFMDLEIFGEKS